jgi:spermidine/putrescine-binding protein
MKKILLGLTLFGGLTLAAAAPALACFQTSSGGDCVYTVITWCSYNQDGSGGLYKAHVVSYVNPNC